MNKQGNNGKFPFTMTIKSLICYIISIILIGLYLFFVRGDQAGKLAACIVCPFFILFLIYAYFRERKADKKADESNVKFANGSYFESPQWHEKYVIYLNEHPFQKPECKSMKRDLLKKFQRREYFVGMILPLLLMIGTICLIPMGQFVMAGVGFILFGFIFYLQLSLYIGMPVRRWLKSDIDYSLLESSYLKSQMLLYKKNGIAFGTTYIHGFTEKKIYAIDYKSVKGISRKIVRLKKYEDGIYNSEEYQHFAVIRISLPQSEKTQNIEIELNEFQVQMAIDKLATYELGKELYGALTVNEQKENENV